MSVVKEEMVVGVSNSGAALVALTLSIFDGADSATVNCFDDGQSERPYR
jgi:hypothetical protein